MAQGREQRLVQEFVTQQTVEALNEGILRGLAGRDVVPVDLAVNLGPVPRGGTGIR